MDDYSMDYVGQGFKLYYFYVSFISIGPERLSPRKIIQIRLRTVFSDFDTCDMHSFWWIWEPCGQAESAFSDVLIIIDTVAHSGIIHCKMKNTIIPRVQYYILAFPNIFKTVSENPLLTEIN